MTTLRHTDPTIYAVAAALYEDTSLTYADIGQRLGLTENEMVNIYQALRNAGELTFQRRVSSTKPQGVGRDMARLIGQSKEQAEFLRHVRKYGWTFEYTGGGHVRCIGPQGQTEIVSSRLGPGAREQFRKHGVTWPGDRPKGEVTVDWDIEEAQAADAMQALEAADAAYTQEAAAAAEVAVAAQAEGALEPIAMPAAELTLELVARSVDNLAEMFEVLAQEVADIKARAESVGREFSEHVETMQDGSEVVAAINQRIDAVSSAVNTLNQRIASVDPIGSLRAALRRDQPRT